MYIFIFIGEHEGVLSSVVGCHAGVVIIYLMYVNSI